MYWQAVKQTSTWKRSLLEFFISWYMEQSTTMQGLKYLSLPWTYKKPVFINLIASYVSLQGKFSTLHLRWSSSFWTTTGMLNSYACKNLSFSLSGKSAGIAISFSSSYWRSSSSFELSNLDNWLQPSKNFLYPGPFLGLLVMIFDSCGT